MAERPSGLDGRLAPAPARAPARTDPIALIDAVERGEAVPGLAPVDHGPDLQPPSRPLAPRGLAGVLDAALGPVELPGLVELADVLARAEAEVARDPAIEPGLGEVIVAVLGDERRKVTRYLDLRGR